MQLNSLSRREPRSVSGEKIAQPMTRAYSIDHATTAARTRQFHIHNALAVTSIMRFAPSIRSKRRKYPVQCVDRAIRSDSRGTDYNQGRRFDPVLRYLSPTRVLLRNCTARFRKLHRHEIDSRGIEPITQSVYGFCQGVCGAVG